MQHPHPAIQTRGGHAAEARRRTSLISHLRPETPSRNRERAFFLVGWACVIRCVALVADRRHHRATTRATSWDLVLPAPKTRPGEEQVHQ